MLKHEFEVVGLKSLEWAPIYNSKPFAAEVLIDDGKANLIRKRQSFDDMINGEIIP